MAYTLQRGRREALIEKTTVISVMGLPADLQCTIYGLVERARIYCIGEIKNLVSSPSNEKLRLPKPRAPDSGPVGQM